MVQLRNSFARGLRAEGFTLIELLIVIAIIAILALIALPNFQDRRVREQIVEAAHFADLAKTRVASAWTTTSALPADNAAVGLPSPDRIVSTLVTSVAVESGAVQIRFGNSANAALTGRTLTLRPAVVADAPVVPVSWVCGHASAPPTMSVQGVDRTDIEARFLPLNCR